MLCRLFDDRKYMDKYLPIPQEYCYLGKQKNSLHFLPKNLLMGIHSGREWLGIVGKGDIIFPSKGAYR